MTETMKAVVVREHGGFDKLLIEDAPKPEIRADEVLINVKASGINHLDLWIRKGVPGHKFPLPMILGTDIAGLVAEKGELVDNVEIGDRVAVMPGFASPTSEEALSGRIHLARDYGRRAPQRRLRRVHGRPGRQPDEGARRDALHRRGRVPAGVPDQLHDAAQGRLATW